MTAQAAEQTEIAPIKPRSRLPLFEAASKFSALMAAIDEGMPITDAVQREFAEGRLDVIEAIDRRKAAMHYLKHMTEAARAAREEMDARVQQLKAAQEALKANTKAIMEKFPDDMYQDSVGRKLSIANNGGKAALKLGFEIRESKSVSNVIDLEVVEFLGIDKKYIKPVSFLTLDTDALRADLEVGANLDWASLERGTHVRGF